MAGSKPINVGKYTGWSPDCMTFDFNKKPATYTRITKALSVQTVDDMA